MEVTYFAPNSLAWFIGQHEDQVWISSDEEETQEDPRRVKAKSEVPAKLEAKGSIARQLIIKTQEPKAIN